MAESGLNHLVQFKHTLADQVWQILTTVPGTAPMRQLTDPIAINS